MNDSRGHERKMIIDTLPKYSAPPAVETLMGFYFQKLPSPPWNILRLGQLWQEFEPHYRQAHTLPPIGTMTFNLPIANSPFDVPIRANFLDDTTNELIQVQDSAFFRNWRATPSGEYSGYDNLLPLFRRDWEIFLAFLKTRQIAPPAVYRCEVTYVNHLVRKKDWNSFEDLSFLLKPLADVSERNTGNNQLSFLRNQVNLNFSLAYSLNDPDVALEISAAPLIRPLDNAEVFQVTVSAKGNVSPDSEDEKWKMISSCHQAVVLGFTDIITPTAQEKFGRSR
jgi:uncharacterized protein (TIGR04255 family)